MAITYYEIVVCILMNQLQKMGTFPSSREENIYTHALILVDDSTTHLEPHIQVYRLSGKFQIALEPNKINVCKCKEFIELINDI